MPNSPKRHHTYTFYAQIYRERQLKHGAHNGQIFHWKWWSEKDEFLIEFCLNFILTIATKSTKLHGCHQTKEPKVKWIFFHNLFIGCVQDKIAANKYSKNDSKRSRFNLKTLAEKDTVTSFTDLLVEKRKNLVGNSTAAKDSNEDREQIFLSLDEAKSPKTERQQDQEA